uniref:Methyltransferase n=1 Tax=Sclerotinia sclerotiorum tetramycovirus-1 TaxID=2231775 RepID=A0A2Z4QKB7_9VIRU|nr:methyltransferase [Sclerotinia sclerotiorum tetramycovirus-1]
MSLEVPRLRLDDSDWESSSDDDDVATPLEDFSSSPGVERRGPPSTLASLPSRRAMSARTDVDVVAASSFPIARVDYSLPPLSGMLSKDAVHRQRDRAHIFLSSPEGQELLRSERLYSRQTRRVLARVTQLRDAHIVVLGSGASRHLLSLFVYGPSRVTFVDPDQVVLARLQSIIAAERPDDLCTAEFSCMGAFQYLASGAPPASVIVMVKCAGLVLMNGRSVGEFFDLAAHALAYDGVLVVDHHIAYAGMSGKVGDLAAPSDYDRATVCGRYADEVAYSMDIHHPEFDPVLSWSPHSNPVQGWKQFVYRKVGGMRPELSTLDRGSVRPVVPFSVQPTGFDSDCDALVPPSTRGTKRVPVPSDRGKFSSAAILPKFDGTGGVLTVQGPGAVFISGTYRFALRLPKTYPTAIHASAELVRGDVTGKSQVVVVTGLLGLGDRHTNPQSLSGLALCRRVLGGLDAAGIVVNGSHMLDLFDYTCGVVRYPTADKRELLLPVDGLNCAIGDQLGNFYKLGSEWSVDVHSETGIDDITLARTWLGYNGGTIQLVMSWSEEADVAEFVPSDAACLRWRFSKHRPDKQGGARGGKLMVDLAAAHSAWRVYGNTYERLIRFLTSS